MTLQQELPPDVEMHVGMLNSAHTHFHTSCFLPWSGRHQAFSKLLHALSDSSIASHVCERGLLLLCVTNMKSILVLCLSRTSASPEAVDYGAY